MAKTPSKNGDSTATSGCEAQYRLTADKLRNNLDATDSPHAVQDLIFRDYSSDNPMPVNESAWFVRVMTATATPFPLLLPPHE
jgi:hypothetical protein